MSEKPFSFEYGVMVLCLIPIIGIGAMLSPGGIGQRILGAILFFGCMSHSLANYGFDWTIAGIVGNCFIFIVLIVIGRIVGGAVSN